MAGTRQGERQLGVERDALDCAEGTLRSIRRPGQRTYLAPTTGSIWPRDDHSIRGVTTRSTCELIEVV